MLVLLQIYPKVSLSKLVICLPPHYRFEDMNRLISLRKLRPVVDKVFSFDQAKEAYEYLASQKHLGKVVIRIA